jgi:hypothetical protein
MDDDQILDSFVLQLYKKWKRLYIAYYIYLTGSIKRYMKLQASYYQRFNDHCRETGWEDVELFKS